MTTNTHGLDLSAIPRNAAGARKWPPEMREKIVALMGTIPLLQLSSDLGIHVTQLHAWRNRINGSAKKAKKVEVFQSDVTILPDTAALIEGLRVKRQALLEHAAQLGKTMSSLAALESGGLVVETVKLSDALVPAKKRKRRLSAEGREAISKAGKKRWAQYRAAKRKK